MEKQDRTGFCQQCRHPYNTYFSIIYLFIFTVYIWIYEFISLYDKTDGMTKDSETLKNKDFRSRRKDRRLKTQ